jgi:peptide/nickel transport system substrate-binding protein
MMSESEPGDHYTLVRNPHYYRAREGLPYLDKVVFRIVANSAIVFKDLETGSVDWAGIDVTSNLQAYQRLKYYTIPSSPVPLTSIFTAMYFNFHNTVLANHREVRQAMAMAIDHQALIQQAQHGFATLLCTDHGSIYHPGYQPGVDCPPFDPIAANKLLNDNGWVKGPDGVRARGKERLEFMYSTSTDFPLQVADEVILQRNFAAIGIKLDIQNYDKDTFYSSFLPGGKASPLTGAIAGRYDIAEFGQIWSYDPDDSSMLSCDQMPPNGQNVDFYCNPVLDALYQQELATADPGVRQQVFDQIHHIYLTEFPFITLYAPLLPGIVRKGTHNLLGSPFEGGTINIWEWWCDRGKC